ncbi:MAG: iron dicitrate transport regulator FecR [Synechococcaceae cyanobacterium]|nr:iron dicitrate transport regulator FecR [Synechococcaceae cyanobacterium]
MPSVLRPAHRPLPPRPVVRLAAAVLLLGAAALAPAPALAARTATVQEILDGRELYIDRALARVRQKAQAPQQVSTGNARGQLSFDNGAVGRLNRHSLLKLGSRCFLIESGQILVSGPQSGCTRSARMSVRGTNYVLEVQENGESDLAVLEGSVQVEPLREGEPSGDPPTTVEAGQRLRLSPEGVVLSILALSAGDYTLILNGPLFEGFRSPLPGFAALESHIRSRVPGVRMPAAPARAPSLPFGVPRLF